MHADVKWIWRRARAREETPHHADDVIMRTEKERERESTFIQLQTETEHQLCAKEVRRSVGRSMRTAARSETLYTIIGERERERERQSSHLVRPRVGEQVVFAVLSAGAFCCVCDG